MEFATGPGRHHNRAEHHQVAAGPRPVTRDREQPASSHPLRRPGYYRRPGRCRRRAGCRRHPEHLLEPQPEPFRTAVAVPAARRAAQTGPFHLADDRE